MHFNMCWPKPLYDQTPHLPARTLDISQHVLTKPQTGQQEHKIYLNLCWPYYSMPARRQNLSNFVLTKQKMYQHVVTNPVQCQRGIKMYLNMCWPNPSHASEDTKCMSTCVDLNSHASEDRQIISICVDRTPILPARTKTASQRVLT
jgi:hypothetical protein